MTLVITLVLMVFGAVVLVIGAAAYLLLGRRGGVRVFTARSFEPQGFQPRPPIRDVTPIVKPALDEVQSSS
jgi:hypothetical protein